MQTVTVGGSTGIARTVDVPAGIDPGWAHNVGRSAWGSGVDVSAFTRVRQPGEESAASLGLGELPTDRAKLGRQARTDGDVARQVDELLQGKGADIITRIGEFAGGVHVNANTLTELASGDRRDRAPFIPALLDTLAAPAEVWVQFFEAINGRAELRLHFLRQLTIAGQRRPVVVSADAQAGQLVAFDARPVTDDELAELRTGRLLAAQRED